MLQGTCSGWVKRGFKLEPVGVDEWEEDRLKRGRRPVVGIAVLGEGLQLLSYALVKGFHLRGPGGR